MASRSMVSSETSPFSSGVVFLIWDLWVGRSKGMDSPMPMTERYRFRVSQPIFMPR